MKAVINKINYYLPETVYNEEQFLNDFSEIKGHKVFEKLGIKTRHVVAKNETASDLAVKAALKLFNDGQIDPTSIEYILFCAQEFDYYTPTTACLIQDRLGIPTNAGALDFNLGCTGFLYGLSIAKGLIETQQCSNVLLLTASSLTKKIHKEDRNLRFLFGDAAAATLIIASKEKTNYGKFIFGSDGSRYDKIIVKDGAGRNPLNNTSHDIITNENGITFSNAMLSMDGVSIFHFSMETVPKLVNQVLDKNELLLDDIDLFIFHQPNKFLLQQLQKKIGIVDEKFVIFIENIGNTVSSTIPIALAECIKNGRAKSGMKIMLIAFGVGLSWTGTVIEL